MPTATPAVTEAQVTEEPPIDPAETLEAVVAFDSNIRSGPGTEFDVVGQAPGGTRVTLIGRDDTANWVQFQAATIPNGWIAATQLQNAGTLDLLTLPISSP
ncbi:MAG: SH3 domain-containing protein [Chloroflexi bacterium]|nr:SH3 domain-containing protein [Chloroflexota bacterium]